MADIHISPLAKADMREIADYIRNELRNPSAALRTIQRIRETAEPLRRFPEMGTPLLAAQQEHLYRYLVCGNYLVFYHVGKRDVWIDRVLYGRRDYLALLLGDRLTEDE